MIIINIGDELLIGQVVNTNASFMAERFNSHGFPVEEIMIIGDKESEIKSAVTNAFTKTDLVVLTGGLGPTKDDITKKVLAELFDTKLVEDEEVLRLIRQMFGRRGIEVSESNRLQALMPEGSVTLPNHNGTAQGIWLEKEGKILVSLPGVPFEMKGIMDDELIPRLLQRFPRKEFIIHKVVQTTGIGESDLSDLLESWELNLPSHIKLAYLPRPGITRLRLTGTGIDKEKLQSGLQKEIEELSSIAAPYIWSYEDNQIEEVVGDLLRKSGGMLAVAESCTGGNISRLITSVPGSSAYFKGSVVSYSNAVKREILNVREQNLKKSGAVSEPVVSDMAINVMGLFDVDYSIAVSGIAGPDGGTEEKPVGTVWIAVATPTRLTTRLFHFGTAGGRETVIQRASVAALGILRQEILKDLDK